uniref:Uncharacterized protein n=1 Tax=Timema tahoe TaxID=61484 RepID=A0A7R9FIR7_9NEOP|nr:unnamed protein product [Timema tahoe]
MEGQDVCTRKVKLVNPLAITSIFNTLFPLNEVDANRVIVGMSVKNNFTPYKQDTGLKRVAYLAPSCVRLCEVWDLVDRRDMWSIPIARYCNDLIDTLVVDVTIYSCPNLSCRAAKLAPGMSHQDCDSAMTSSENSFQGGGLPGSRSRSIHVSTCLVELPNWRQVISFLALFLDANGWTSAAVDKYLELVQYVDTRWSSKYLMLKRLIEMQGTLNVELASRDNTSDLGMLTAQDWRYMNVLVEILQPLAKATEELRGDIHPTSSGIYPNQSNQSLEYMNKTRQHICQNSGSASLVSYLLADLKQLPPSCWKTLVRLFKRKLELLVSMLFTLISTKRSLKRLSLQQPTDTTLKQKFIMVFVFQFEELAKEAYLQAKPVMKSWTKKHLHYQMKVNFVVAHAHALNKVIQRGKMDIVFRFWDKENHKVVSHCLDSVFFDRSTAEELLKHFSDVYCERNALDHAAIEVAWVLYVVLVDLQDAFTTSLMLLLAKLGGCMTSSLQTNQCPSHPSVPASDYTCYQVVRETVLLYFRPSPPYPDIQIPQLVGKHSLNFCVSTTSNSTVIYFHDFTTVNFNSTNFNIKDSTVINSFNCIFPHHNHTSVTSACSYRTQMRGGSGKCTHTIVERESENYLENCMPVENFPIATDIDRNADLSLKSN